MNCTQVVESKVSIEDRSMVMLACELHDGPCQHLVAAFCHLDAFRRLQSSDPGNAAKEFYRGFTALRRGLEALRNLLSDIRPLHIQGASPVGGIEDLIEEYASTYGLLVTFSHTPQNIDLPPVLKTAVFRTVQEGLANVRRHSRSKAVRLGIIQRENCVRVEIEDWGVGFDPAAIGRHCFGLAGIRARAALLGGDMYLTSKPGEGTLVVVDLPVLPANNAESHGPAGRASLENDEAISG